MNTTKKIILGGIIIIVLAIISSLIVVAMISEQIRQTAISNAEKSNASYLTSVATGKLTVKDFESQNFDEKKITFKNYFDSVKNDQTLRIKVWAKDGTIIYSDGSTIVGDNFASNPRFQNSINGQLLSEIKDPVEPENIDETGYGQLMEIYVPIYLNQLEPVGVIELYFSMDSINDSVNKVNNLVVTIAVILIGLISLAIIVFSAIVAHSSKQTVEQEKFATIGELSSKLSHDIRNPLSILYYEFTLLKHKKIIDKKQSQRIGTSLKRISHQVDEVLDYVRDVPLQYAKFSLNEVVHSAIDSLVVPDQIKINVTSNEVFIKADKHKIEIIFINLILNSIQSIKNTGTIDVTISETNTEIVVKIKDSGSGIAVDLLDKIFDPLFTTKQQGTGLGLASVKNIIEQHNGSITVENNPTTFIIKLPKMLD